MILSRNFTAPPGPQMLHGEFGVGATVVGASVGVAGAIVGVDGGGVGPPTHPHCS